MALATLTATARTDILWRDSSGNVGLWLMNGTQILSTSVLGNDARQLVDCRNR